MVKDVKVKVESSEASKSKLNFYLIIYDKIKLGGNITDIVKEYGVNKQNLTFYINKLKQLKIIDNKNLDGSIWAISDNSFFESEIEIETLEEEEE